MVFGPGNDVHSGLPNGDPSLQLFPSLTWWSQSYLHLDDDLVHRLVFTPPHKDRCLAASLLVYDSEAEGNGHKGHK